MADQEIKKIALVISGGTCRGAAQIAFANEIIKRVGIERICVVSGTSIGALSTYAVGVNHMEHLIEAYRQLDCDNTRHFVRKIKNDLYNDTFNLIEDDIKVPTYVCSTRIWGMECNYFCLNHMPRKDLKMAINCAMALPTINGPHRFLRHWWIDGGATDNVPVLPVTYYDPDMVIILHCFSKYYPPQFLFDKLRKDAIVIDVDISLNFPDRWSPFSFSKTDFEYMTEQGKIDGQELVEALFQDFDKENVRQRVYKYINDHMEKRHNKTWNGYMDFVEVLNTLYQIKEDM